jgi:hypothetical protein
MFKVFRRRKKEEAAPAPAAPTPAPKPKEEAKTNRSVPKEKPKPNQTPEEMCGIAPNMPKEKIHEELAKLFRRHNRAAASLDQKLREEAEIMLDAIVSIRERYL